VDCVPPEVGDIRDADPAATGCADDSASADGSDVSPTRLASPGPQPVAPPMRTAAVAPAAAIREKTNIRRLYRLRCWRGGHGGCPYGRAEGRPAIEAVAAQFRGVGSLRLNADQAWPAVARHPISRADPGVEDARFHQVCLAVRRKSRVAAATPRRRSDIRTAV
jgi:hypothetical protein